MSESHRAEQTRLNQQEESSLHLTGSAYGLTSASPFYSQNIQIILQHLLPGQKGNLGNNTVNRFPIAGPYRFDANFGKTFRISETKSFVVRFDALNVLNHPTPAAPNLAIDPNAMTGVVTPFGQIASKGCGATGQCRAMQGQLRFNF